MAWSPPTAGNPDVFKLLQILGAGTNAQPQLQQTQQPQQPRQQQAWPPPAAPPVPAPQKPPPSSLEAPAAPHPRPDPQSITTLASARRYVVHHLSKDKALLGHISRMRARQHGLEREWSANRAELQRRHSSRAESSAKLAGILKNLGVDALNEKAMKSEEDELREFDQKVLRRFQDMRGAMSLEFANMGVPGFCAGKEQEWRWEVVELLEDLCEEVA